MTRISHPVQIREQLLPTLLCALLALLTGGCARDDGPDKDRLLQGLANADPDIRYESVKALGRMGAEAKDAVPHIGNLLADADAGVRVGAAHALGKIGHDAVSTAPLMIAALSDKDDDVREAAAYALPALGADAATIIPKLKAIAQTDPSPGVRQAAARSARMMAPVEQFRRAVENRAANKASKGSS